MTLVANSAVIKDDANSCIIFFDNLRRIKGFCWNKSRLKINSQSRASQRNRANSLLQAPLNKLDTRLYYTRFYVQGSTRWNECRLPLWSIRKNRRRLTVCDGSSRCSLVFGESTDLHIKERLSCHESWLMTHQVGNERETLSYVHIDCGSLHSFQRVDLCITIY